MDCDGRSPELGEEEGAGDVGIDMLERLACIMVVGGIRNCQAKQE